MWWNSTYISLLNVKAKADFGLWCFATPLSQQPSESCIINHSFTKEIRMFQMYINILCWLIVHRRVDVDMWAASMMKNHFSKVWKPQTTIEGNGAAGSITMHCQERTKIFWPSSLQKARGLETRIITIHQSAFVLCIRPRSSFLASRKATLAVVIWLCCVQFLHVPASRRLLIHFYSFIT